MPVVQLFFILILSKWLFWPTTHPPLPKVRVKVKVGIYLGLVDEWIDSQPEISTDPTSFSDAWIHNGLDESATTDQIAGSRTGD